MALFRALLLASSLGWSLAAEIDTASYGQPSTPGYYDAGNSTTWCSGCASTGTGFYPPAPIVATMKSQDSLIVPTRTFKKPATMETQQSLGLPGIYTAHLEDPESSLDGPGPTTIYATAHIESSQTGGLTYFSPRTGVTMTSLDIPVPSPVTAHTDDGGLIVPTKQSQVLPDGNKPIETDAPENPNPNPGAVFVSIISLIDSYTQQGSEGHAAAATETYVYEGHTIAPGSSGVVVEGTTYSLAETGGAVYVNGVETVPTAVPGLSGSGSGSGSGYVYEGHTIAPGGTGTVIEGTTYSVAATGGAVYVNGVETAATAVPVSGGLGDAIMSGIRGQEGETTMTTATSGGAASASASTYSPAQQTTSGSGALRISIMSWGLGLFVAVLS